MASRSQLDILRNVFEMDNARNQHERQLPRTFVPTQIYWRLFADKNQILVGTRGSGKTAILKMLSLPYLRHVAEGDFQEVIEDRRYIGIYIPVTTLWLGPLKAKHWSNVEEKGREFLWHFSIAACQSLTKTVEALLISHYAELEDRLSIYSSLIRRFEELWFPGEDGSDASSFQRLRERLGSLPREKNLFEAQQYLDPLGDPSLRFPGGAGFYSQSLDPFLHAIESVQRAVGRSDDETSWLICLDEVETLDKDIQVVLNSFMRSDFGNRYFKIATLPYAHKTRETNLAAPLSVGNDFEYLWVDEDPTSHENALRGAVGNYSSVTFAHQLFRKRRDAAGPIYARTTLDQLFGKNSLLSPVDWVREAYAGGADGTVIEVFQELSKHFNEPTVERSDRLVRSAVAGGRERGINTEFGDQLLRKTLGFLLLREAVQHQSGPLKLQVYSGSEMLVRLADGNARTLIRLINSMLRDGNWRRSRSSPRIARRRQNEIFTRFSRAVLDRTKSEEDAGPALYALLTAMGFGLRRLFYDRKLGSDVIGRVRFAPDEFVRHRREIELGMQLGLLRVDFKPGTDFSLPVSGGILRMSYILSPAFGLMPRKGRVAALESVTGGAPIEHPNFNFGPPGRAHIAS